MKLFQREIRVLLQWDELWILFQVTSPPFCMKLNALCDTLWTRTFRLTNQVNGDYGTQEDRNGHVIETADSMALIGFHHSSYQLSQLVHGQRHFPLQ